MSQPPKLPSKEPQYGPITITLDAKEWYAAMYVARTMRGVSIEQFCKDAVNGYVHHTIVESMQGDEKKGFHFDPTGWFQRNTRVGIKRAQPNQP